MAKHSYARVRYYLSENYEAVQVGVRRNVVRLAMSITKHLHSARRIPTPSAIQPIVGAKIAPTSTPATTMIPNTVPDRVIILASQLVDPGARRQGTVNMREVDLAVGVSLRQYQEVIAVISCSESLAP